MADYTLTDLFCGIGGMTLGFVEAGFRPIFALDHDRFAAATYQANFGDHVVCGDIRQVKEFPDADVVVGGPPCQGFSRLGKQTHGRPTEQSFEGNGLWEQYFRCVEEKSPKLFVIENVPDFFKHFAWEGVRRESKRLGYELAHSVLNAADYGVPQKRHRAIIIGSRIGRPTLPTPTHTAAAACLLGLQPWRTVRDAISDLPLDPDGSNRHDIRNVSALALKRYMAIPPGGNRRNLPDELNLLCWRNKNPKSGGSADLMGRLLWDAPALTIRTQFLKPEKGRYLHPQAHRSISVREGARLQTFPDDFKLVGSNFQAAQGIGNAVPPMLARCVAFTVRNMLDAWNRRLLEQPFDEVGKRHAFSDLEVAQTAPNLF